LFVGLSSLAQRRQQWTEPGHPQQDYQKSQPKPNRCPAVLVYGQINFLGQSTAKMYEHNSQDHEDEMLYREKAEITLLHDIAEAEVAKGLEGEWAEKNVQQQANQHLEIDGRCEVPPDFRVCGDPGMFAEPANECSQDSQEAQDQDHPADNIVNC
jgi:hypothetical protein